MEIAAAAETVQDGEINSSRAETEAGQDRQRKQKLRKPQKLWLRVRQKTKSNCNEAMGCLVVV